MPSGMYMLYSHRQHQVHCAQPSEPMILNDEATKRGAASGRRTNQCSSGQMINCPSQAPLDLSQSAIRFNTVETRAITDRMLKTDESDH